MIRALVFDFDGVIIDTETTLIDACELIHRRAGRPFSRQLAGQAVGLTDLHFDLWTGFGPDADRPALDAELKRVNRELVVRQPVLPGVLEYLQEAKALRLQIGLASNSSHAHVEGHLARLGLAEWFDYLRCIEDVSAGKPEPDLYCAVIEKFSLTGREALAIEDSEHGAHAAKRAGLWCAAVPGPSSLNHDFAHADLTLPSLAHCPLAELLQRFAE